MPVTRPLFFKEGTETYKDVECVRVDGSTDEGPSHHEVQFLWTERHINKATRIMLVTRCSGDSYLNRVELQNSCLSRDHSNLFIPSTLHGSPYGSDGKIDENKYKKNMSAAVEQYVNRVDGTSCMNTKIHLAKGADSSNLLVARRQQKLLIFLKGNKADKESLKVKDPTLFTYFSEVWSVRNNHIDDTLPGKYVFLLKCCSRRGCPHPVCQGKVAVNV